MKPVLQDIRNVIELATNASYPYGKTEQASELILKGNTAVDSLIDLLDAIANDIESGFMGQNSHRGEINRNHRAQAIRRFLVSEQIAGEKLGSNPVQGTANG